MKDFCYFLAIALCLGIIFLSEKFFQPKFIAPQELLSDEQKEMLYRFPKKLNDATIEDLMEISGIGEKKALDIYTFLQKYNVTSFEQLKLIKGIGEATVEDLQKYFFID